MSVYIVGFSTEDEPMAAEVSGTGAGTATMPDGDFAHVALGDGGITDGADYAAFGAAFEAVLDALSAGFTVTYDATTYYTISRASGTFGLTFTGTAGENLRRALGFSGDALPAALSHTSDVRPYYLIEPVVGARSEFSDLYEPDDLTAESVSDGGTAYGVARLSDEYHCDWVQQVEDRAATYASAATSAVPWTWQHFYRHARSTHLFAVVDGIEEAGRVYQLRADGAAFTSDIRTPAEDDVNTMWHLTLRTRDLGVLP